jgi:hypothetical protein
VARDRRIIQATVQRQAHGLMGEQLMARNRNDMNPGDQNPQWLGFAKFLFIVILTVTVFLLIRSMVHHHFFSGGQMNKHDVTEQ